jgi:hypothetical protein
MLVFSIIFLGFITASISLFFWMELSITNDRLRWLEERLTKLEKDAVKVTFVPPFSTGDEVIVHPKVKISPCVGHELESQEEEKKQTKKRKPKTTKDWEDEFDLGGHE